MLDWKFRLLILILGKQDCGKGFLFQLVTQLYPLQILARTDLELKQDI